jgi:hypothetical protein
MKKVMLLMVTLLGGVIVGLIVGLFLPAEKRARLSQPFADRCGRMLERIPDELPQKKIMCGVHQTLEQNVRIPALLQEQLAVEEPS